MTKRYPPLKLLREQAKILQSIITGKDDKPLRLSTCYFCIAKMWGFTDWAILLAVLQKIELQKLKLKLKPKKRRRRRGRKKSKPLANRD
jgi:hypothetical protein